MNPLNLIMSYFIANSRAEFYNVKDPQEIQKTGLIAGMISNNPVISYLLIENKAKELEVIPARNPASTATETQGNKFEEGSTPQTNTQDPVLKKLKKIDERLEKNQEAIGKLTETIEKIPTSLLENKKVVEVIDSKNTELPNVVKEDKKVDAISNVNAPLVTKSIPITKK